jgi:hypothetical protein
MNITAIRAFFFAAASTLVAAAPTSLAHAQATSTPLLSPEQVRAEYLNQGFQTSAPMTWWTNGSTTFTVEDPTEQNSPSARVLMVIVYPDLANARAAHRDDGHLVPGYGPSVWLDNVALVQTTRGELARRFAAEVERNDPTFVQSRLEPERMAEASFPVALDFLAVLHSETVNL